MKDTTVSVQVPSERFRPFVRRFMTVEFHADLTDFHLPDTGLVAAFRLRGTCALEKGVRAPRAALTGLRDAVRSHRHERGSSVALISFTPLGASAFFRDSLGEFANRTVDLEALLSVSASVNDELAEAPEGSQAEILERFLLRLNEAPTFDPVVAAAVARIERSGANLRMLDLAQWVGLSQSALERRFRRQVGTSPKRFASLVRLQRVLRLQTTGRDFAYLAHEAGYYDQSHFNKDFRRLTGQAPESFFGRAETR